MIVFLSHQKQDTAHAGLVCMHLKQKHDVRCYLDVLDPYLDKDGDDLAQHLHDRLSQCDQLMAVVSSNTKQSWWVPWEIGIATEKVYPITTYAAGLCELPDYLKKWPYLRTLNDLDIYVNQARRLDLLVKSKETYGRAIDRKERSDMVALFHKGLKGRLGQ